MRTRLPVLVGIAIALLSPSGCRPKQQKFTPDLTSPTPGVGRLVTGRDMDVVPLSAQNVGSIPLNLVTTADGKYLISTSAGFRENLVSICLRDGAGVSGLTFPRTKGKDVPDDQKYNGLFYGLATAPGVIYAAQGNLDRIAVVKIDEAGQLDLVDQIRTRKGDFPSGLAIDGQGRLYVANNDPQATPPDPVPSSVAVYDTRTNRELGRFHFKDSFGGTANFPMAVAVTRDGRTLYVASQRDDAVYVLDASDPKKIALITRLTTGSHPIALLLDRQEKRLFVANAHSDTVSIVDVASQQIRRTILLRPDVAGSLSGATPTGLAMSPDEKRLFVTLGDMNAVAVIDVPDQELGGYIPAGWYPTAIAVTPDGQRLLVANAKGTHPINPNPPPDPARHNSDNRPFRSPEKAARPHAAGRERHRPCRSRQG